MAKKIRDGGKRTKSQNNTAVLRELLKEREDAVQANSDLLETDRWTLSTVYYRLRLLLIQRGIKVRTRKHLTETIKDICDKMGYKRHELGIIAAARAVFDFRDKSVAVGFDDIGYLAKKGTDVIIIEKEGVAEVLGPYAKKYGIALMFTRGFAPEYAMLLAGETDANIAILTDFDASGLLISKKIEQENYHQNIKWIGVNPEMLEKLGLNRADVQEKYVPDPGHYNTLASIADTAGDGGWLQSWIPYLKNTRVEIDSVQAAAGTERLWNYIFEYMKKEFPTRDYNRAVRLPDYVLSATFTRFFDYIKDTVADLQEEMRSEIQEELQVTEGFLEVEDKEREINQGLADSLDETITEEYTSSSNFLIKTVREFFKLEKERPKGDNDDDFIQSSYTDDDEDVDEDDDEDE